MKTFKLLLCLLLVSFVINSCSSDENKQTNSESFSIVGDWYNYKRSRKILDNDSLPPAVTTCGTAGSDFNCNVSISYFANGTGKYAFDGSTFNYSYTDGVLKFNGIVSEIKVLAKDEYSTVSIATQAGVKYETTNFYKKK